MSDSEKLNIACSILKDAIQKQKVKMSDMDIKKRWVEFALRGSVQTRAKKRGLNSACFNF